MTKAGKRILIALGLVTTFWAIGRQLPGMQVEAAEVELYTTSACDACQQAKAYLYRNDIPFNEHNIDSDPAQRARFDELGGKGVPLILVRGQRLDGFDAARFDALWRGTPSSL